MRKKIKKDLSIIVEPISIQYQRSLPKAKHIKITSSTIRISNDQLKYIKDVSDLKSPFHSEIKDLPPDGYLPMDIVESENSIQIETTMAADASTQFSFWDPERYNQWQPSLKTEKWGQIFDEDIQKIESLANITNWSKGARVFLTDCCIECKGFLRYINPLYQCDLPITTVMDSHKS